MAFACRRKITVETWLLSSEGYEIPPSLRPKNGLTSYKFSSSLAYESTSLHFHDFSLSITNGFIGFMKLKLFLTKHFHLSAQKYELSVPKLDRSVHKLDLSLHKFIILEPARV